MPRIRASSSSRKGGREAGKTGASCELFVMADLLSRGFEVTKPLSAQAKHDLHVKLGSKWYGVQVKAARYNTSTGKLHKQTRGASPVLALVYLPLWKIDYRAGTETLPNELVTDLENSIQEHEAWRSSCTCAARAKANRLREGFTRAGETSNSATSAGSN